MPCTVSLTSVVAFKPSDNEPPSRIEVSGTSGGCDRLEVLFTADGTEAGPLGVLPDPQGVWTAVFEAGPHFGPGAIRCDAKAVTVDAWCVDPPDLNCNVSAKYTSLTCRTEGQTCPVIEGFDVRIPDQCNADGSRTVSLSVSVAPAAAGQVFAHWRHDEEDGAAHVISTGQTVADSHDYVADGQSHRACLDILAPEGCASACTDFIVPACGVALCPSIEFLDPVAGEQCDREGRRSVTVRARVAGAEGQSISARLIGPEGNVLASGSGEESVELLGSGQFAPGMRRFMVRVDDPARCPSSTLQVRVEKCPDTGTGGGGGPGGNGQEGGEGGGIPWCLIWFGICVGLVIAAGVAIVVAGCTADPWAIGIAIALVLASIVNLILWGIFCARSACLPLLWFIGILAPIVPIAAIIGGILVGLGVPSCGIGGFLEAGYLGTILAIAYYIARCSGCLQAPDRSVRCFP